MSRIDDTACGPATPQVGAPPRPVRPWVGSPRIPAGLLLAACLALLGVSLWLKPDDRGLGTHQQLGFPPCGFERMTGLPCPTCGMTTAFAHAARGNLVQALVVQPAGALLALATAVTALVSGYALVTGAALAPLARRLGRPWALVAGGALLLAGWIYKIVLALGAS